MPLVANASPHDTDGVMALFNPPEREYVRTSLKRNERTEVLRSLKRRRRAPRAPLRIEVLQSGLPESVRINIFEELRINP